MSPVHTVQGSVAPWAEVVHGAPRMTLAEFLDYEGQDGYRYELVEGVLVRMGGTRPRAGRVTRQPPVRAGCPCPGARPRDRHATR